LDNLKIKDHKILEGEMFEDLFLTLLFFELFQKFLLQFEWRVSEVILAQYSI